MSINSVSGSSASLALIKTRLANVKLNSLGSNVRQVQSQAATNPVIKTIAPSTLPSIGNTPLVATPDPLGSATKKTDAGVIDNTPFVSYPGINTKDEKATMPGIDPDEKPTMQEKLASLFANGKDLISKMIDVAKKASDVNLSANDRAGLNEQFMKLRSAYENLAGKYSAGFSQTQQSNLNGLFALTKIGISGLVPGQGDLTSAQNAKATASILEKRINQVPQVWDNMAKQMVHNDVPPGTGGIKSPPLPDEAANTKPIDNTQFVSHPGLVADIIGGEAQSKKLTGINIVA